MCIAGQQEEHLEQPEPAQGWCRIHQGQPTRPHRIDRSRAEREAARRLGQQLADPAKFRIGHGQPLRPLLREPENQRAVRLVCVHRRT